MTRKLLIAVSVWCALTAWVRAESIASYVADITVNTDSSLSVRETIGYDFGPLERHGIYRDILKDSENGPRTVISDIHVTDGSGAVLSFSVSQTRTKTGIRIGDAEQTVTGRHVYVVSYRVENEVRYFTDRDEIYWDAIPNGFDVPISGAQAVVRLPAPALGEPYCYTGAQGSTSRDCSVSTTGSTVTFTAARELAPREGMTVAAAVSPGAIRRVAAVREGMSAVLVAAIVIAATLFSVAVILLSVWLFRGTRLPRKRYRDGGPIIVQYDPPKGITAPQAGYLATGGKDKNVITAGVIQLAIDGWLHLEFKEVRKWLFKSRDIVFSRAKDGTPADDFSSALLDMFTPGAAPYALSELKKAVTKQEIKPHELISGVRNSLVEHGIVRLGWLGLRSDPTPAGREAMEHLAGLREYITMAEKRRLEFHNAPEHSPQTFEKLLPYAIALGVDEPWQKAFADVLTEPPRWAGGSIPPGNFAFAAAIGGISSGVGSLVNTYSSGTGGGGFSGGGGGGGGGGSW